MKLCTAHALIARFSALVAVVATSGCTVGPDYARPDIHTPDAWHEVLSLDVSKGSDASLQTWWKVFEDPALDEFIERARKANLDLKVALSSIRESRARLAMARGKKVPRVDVSGAAAAIKHSDTGVLEQVAPPGGFDAQGLLSVGVDATWELDVFGRLRRKIESAGAGYQASVEDYRDVLVTLFAEVAMAYIEVRSYQQQIVYAQQNVKAQRESLSLTEDRFESGVSSQLDVAQARSNLANTEASIPQMRIGLTHSLNRLAVLLGQDAGSLQAEFATTKPIPTAHAGIGLGVPADVLRQRPDVRRAERQLAAQTAMIGVATADLYPRFALNGFIGFESRSLGDLFGSSGLTWGAAVPVQWNVFSGGRTRSNIAVQEEGTQQALLLYEKSVLLALEEVENSIVSYNQRSVRRDRMQDAVTATQEAVDLVTAQYSAGLTDFNNVLDTQRSLFAQQNELVSSVAGVTLDLIALYKALGGGWGMNDAADSPTNGDGATLSSSSGVTDREHTPTS